MMNDTKKLLVVLAVLAVALLAVTERSQGANIAWESITDISAASDIDISGVSVEAINFGEAADYTVNGVTFVGTTTAGSSTYSDFSALNHGSYSGKFSDDTGDEDYNDMMDTYINGPKSVVTYTLQALTSGQAYTVQFFAADQSAAILENDGGPLTGGTSASGPLFSKGQYVIGTFTADATTQTITHEYRVDYPTGLLNRPRLNAYQLRAVPEPSTIVLLSMAGLALLLRFRRKK